MRRFPILLLWMLIHGTAFAQNYVVETVAGTGTAGYLDTTATIAMLNNPQGLVFDGNGTIYFADNLNSVIRAISPSGAVYTVAGTGVSGHTNGPVATAQFASVLGLELMPGGDLFVTEIGNWVRQISGGQVSDYAGNGTAGNQNGAASIATFSAPSGVLRGKSNNLFILDRFNNKIREIDLATGIVSDYAGSGAAGFQDGPAGSARFNRPIDFDIDGEGNLYVADRDNNAIRKVDTNGFVTTVAGTGASGLVNGNGSMAQFASPHGVAVDLDGNLYVSDRGNHVLRKIDTTNVVTTFAGSGVIGFQDGALSSARLNTPNKIDFDASTGFVYWSESGNDVIRRIVPDDQFCDTLVLTDTVTVTVTDTVIITIRDTVYINGGRELQDPTLEGLKAYPNPVSDYLYVEYILAQAADVRIRITDVAGRLVADQRLPNTVVGEHRELLEISPSIAAGNLTVIIDVGDKPYFLKILKAE